MLIVLSCVFVRPAFRRKESLRATCNAHRTFKQNVMLKCSLPNFIPLLGWLVVGLLLCVLGINLIHKNETSYAKVI